MRWIADDAFRNCTRLRGSLTIPNCINEIGNYAFYGCTGFDGALSLGDITRIKDCTFANCSHFTGELVIPNSVSSIGVSAFEGCSGFTGTLTIPNSIEVITHDLFNSCTGFTGLNIPNSVTDIKEFAFYGCAGLAGNLTIPNSVVNIKSKAFKNCVNLTGSLTIGSSVGSIESEAFKNCGFTGEVTIRALTPPRLIDSGESQFDGVPATTLKVLFPSGAAYNASDWTNHFTNIDENRTLVIDDLVYDVKTNNKFEVVAHANGSSATGGVTIPATIESIGANAISDCPNLIVVNMKPVTPPTLEGDEFEYDFRGVSGMFIIRVETDNGVATKRVVVM